MLDDLYLLESGRLAYKGSIPDAASYFASIGCGNPKGINPADYYLDLVQGDGEGPGWRTLFEESRYNTKYQHALEAAVKSTVSKPPPAAPSSLLRFGYTVSEKKPATLTFPYFSDMRTILKFQIEQVVANQICFHLI